MRRCLGLLICLGVVLSVPPGPALANPLSLEQLINHALQHNQGLDETKWKVRGAEARLRQAKAAYILPRLRLESENGLVPEAAGNAFNTTSDTSGLRPLGPFTRSQLEFVQPLYTFGQLGNLHRAAAEGLSVDKAELEAARLQVGREVQEYYYGLLLARDLQDLVLQLLEELEGRQDELDETVSLATTYKLELALLQLRSQASEAAHAHSLARRALAWTAGLDTTHPLELAENSLQPVAFERPPLDSLTIAYTERPDWQQLMAGIAAKQALADAAGSKFYPQIFLAGGMRHAYAPNRTDQHNPFVKDDFNYFNFGAFLGVRQSFEWSLMTAERDRARAEVLQLRAKEANAERGIGLEVERAYRESEQTETELDAASQRRRTTRRWLVEAKEEYEFDPDQIKGLVTAFEAWAQSEQGYLDAVYRFNMATVELAQSVGRVNFLRPQERK